MLIFELSVSYPNESTQSQSHFQKHRLHISYIFKSIDFQNPQYCCLIMVKNYVERIGSVKLKSKKFIYHVSVSKCIELSFKIKYSFIIRLILSRIIKCIAYIY